MIQACSNSNRLGPVLWQFAATKKFAKQDFGNFSSWLPPSLKGRALRHGRVRHDSFCVPDFIALLRQFEHTVVFARARQVSAIADVVATSSIARLQKGNDDSNLYPRSNSCLGKAVSKPGRRRQSGRLTRVDPARRNKARRLSPSVIRR